MQVDTTVSEGAITWIMPIFAKIQHVIESTTIFDGRVYAWWTHFLFVWFFSIFNIIICKFMIRVTIHASVYFSVQFPLLYESCCLDILQEFLLC